jgi:hypothetical protein
LAQVFDTKEQSRFHNRAFMRDGKESNAGKLEGRAMAALQEWKDRGWWASVEINRRASGRKGEDRAFALLEAAAEHYHLRFSSGQTVTRGIFTRQAELQSLASLLELAGRWRGTVVHVKGNRLEAAAAQRAARFVKCAAHSAPCRSGGREQRGAYLGCHLARIGLLNYSLAALKGGQRYWFSYLKTGPGGKAPITLDKAALTQAVTNSGLCPLFPAQTTAVLARLPASVDLRPDNHRLFWVATRLRIRSGWLTRFPPVVPYSEKMYRTWIEAVLDD